MKRAPWYQLLLAARRIAERGEDLTSIVLGAEAKLPTREASAWLSKFYRWGYALKIGRQGTKGRPATIWQLTDWGLRYKVGKRAKTTLKLAANPRRQPGVNDENS